MPSEDRFINREDELDEIDRIVRDSVGSQKLLFIFGEGGVGKTRLLEEICYRYMNRDLSDYAFTVLSIFDLDAYTYRSISGLRNRIIQELGRNSFGGYLQKLSDLRKMERTNFSLQRIDTERDAVNREFILNLNSLLTQHTLVLLFDTVEALAEYQILQYVDPLLGIQNSVLIFAGRDGIKIAAKEIQQKVGNQNLHLFQLSSFEVEASKSYISAKRARLAMAPEPELDEKLILLSGGRPILLDLAIEWRKIEIPLDWIVKTDIIKLMDLSEDQLAEKQREFESHLVSRFANTTNELDWLVLAMAIIYPLDTSFIATLLRKQIAEADHLFEEAQKRVYVKKLPNNFISLHDEMRVWVNRDVWPQVDPDNTYQNLYFERASSHIENKIGYFEEQLRKLNASEGPIVSRNIDDSTIDATVFLNREEINNQLWTSRIQRLSYLLHIDLVNGLENFFALFDLARNRFSIRTNLLEIVDSHLERSPITVSASQTYEINTRKIDMLMYHGQYNEARLLVEKTLQQKGLDSANKATIFSYHGNALARMGNLKSAIRAFSNAVKESEESGEDDLLVRATNGLGWAYRLTGDLETAKRHYLAIETLLLEKEELGSDYGWLQNNLTFVLSEYERPAAISRGKNALEHWKQIGDEIGIAAAHSTLGIVYYRSDLFQNAEEEFDEALRIFQSIRHDEWRGQVLSWRGALYQDMALLDQAQSDLESSLEHGAVNIRPMTLNRLGRVYMARANWDMAENLLWDSLNLAKEVPDYVYWLGSIGRLASVAAEKKEYDRLPQFEELLSEFKTNDQTPEKNSLGLTYLSFARLALGGGDISRGIEYLKLGIPLVTEFGSYARADIASRLSHVEKVFTDLEPHEVRHIGNTLRKTIQHKLTKDRDARYGLPSRILHRWEHWHEDRVEF